MEVSSDTLHNDEIENRSMICQAHSILMQKVILPSTSFRGHELERSKVLDLMKRTVTMGESNSALLIGPRGCGKTTLVNTVLDELDNSGLLESQALVVKLNGLVHTNDNLALRGTTRQMGLENAVGNKVFGTFAENLMFLLESLKAGDRDTSKAVLFLLDEFDLFCDHHNQTLLYNLFDVAQSAQAPICVLGLTCRLDVVELLEKRVKSRFSHRQIFLFPPSNDLPGRAQLFKEFLLLPMTERDVDKRFAAFARRWNKDVDSLAKHAEVRNVLRRMYEVDVNESTLRKFLVLVVSQLDPIEHQKLEPKDFITTYKEITKDAKVSVMESLSVLEMCLLIAMKHHTDIFEGQPFNFEMILSRYLKFLLQNPSSFSTSRPVIMKAYEHLCSLELIARLGGVSSSQKEYQLYDLLVLPHQITEAVKGYARLPTEVEQWAKSCYQ